MPANPSPADPRLPVTRGEPLEISFDGTPIPCFAGETVAAALLASGVHRFGTRENGEPRQPFCNMGTCFDCVVTVDGAPLIRSCLTPVRDGMQVTPTKGI